MRAWLWGIALIGAPVLLAAQGLGAAAVLAQDYPPVTAAPLAPEGSSGAGQPDEVTANPGLADSRQFCKRELVIDGEVRSWNRLEVDADRAWKAYTSGDYSLSVPLFERLAKIGHPVAQWLMGFIYFYGQGVPLDYRTSLTWFERAAEQGCFGAFAPTAQMHERGQGTSVDLGRAYMWYNIAVAQLPDSKERDQMIGRREALAAQMTPAQVEAAQKRSLYFKPKQILPPDPEDLPLGYLRMQ